MALPFVWKNVWEVILKKPLHSFFVFASYQQCDRLLKKKKPKLWTQNVKAWEHKAWKLARVRKLQSAKPAYINLSLVYKTYSAIWGVQNDFNLNFMNFYQIKQLIFLYFIFYFDLFVLGLGFKTNVFLVKTGEISSLLYSQQGTSLFICFGVGV